MYNIIQSIKKSSSKTNVYPTPDKLFKAFNECPYDKLKVVILGQDPYASSRATGIAFANEDKDNNKIQPLSPSLVKILDALEVDTDFRAMFTDYSFVPWANQGVLMLNSALTVEMGNYGSHILLWRPFTKYLVSRLNKENTGLIFCLWGGEAKKYKQLINEKKHYVLEAHHPTYAVRNNKDWKCSHFSKVNEILKANNGAGYEIKW